jgi:2-iminobutanoate/2-iminopropanoate deaminase
MLVALGIWIAGTIILSVSLKTTRTMDVIHTDNAPKPVGNYNVAKAYDKLVFLSGQVGLDPKTSALVDGINQQTHQVIKNLQAVLAAANSSIDRVLKCTVFLTVRII